MSGVLSVWDVFGVLNGWDFASHTAGKKLQHQQSILFWLDDGDVLTVDLLPFVDMAQWCKDEEMNFC